jgi:hypothetical protein
VPGSFSTNETCGTRRNPTAEPLAAVAVGHHPQRVRAGVVPRAWR